MLAKLFLALSLFVFVANAQTVLNLGSTINDGVAAGSSNQYSFSWSNANTGNGYQYISVVPDLGSATPQSTIAGQSITGNANLQCSAATSSDNGQIDCNWAFSACVTTGAPQTYTITVKPPRLTAFVNYTISAFNVDAVLTAGASTVNNIPVCCGVTGVSWVYLNAGSLTTLQSVTVTLANGNLTTSSLLTGNIALPPGVYIIPATTACTNFNPLTATTQLVNALTAQAQFSANLNGDSATTSVTITLSQQTQGLSFYALVVAGGDSSGHYNVAAAFQSNSNQNTNSASADRPFWL